MNFGAIFKIVMDAAKRSLRLTPDDVGLTDFGGYRMVMALSDGFLNAKFKKVFSEHTVQGLPWKITGDERTWSITIHEFAAPEIDFNSGVRDGVRLKRAIKRGTFESWSYEMEGGAPKVTHSQIDLGDFTIISTIDVSNIRHEGWKPGALRAQSTFLDLENVHAIELDVSDGMKVQAGSDIAVPLAKLILTDLKARGKAHPMQGLFGGVDIHPLPSHDDAETYLTPQGYTYSTTIVRDSNGAYSYGVLNVLFLIDGIKEFPTGKTAGEVQTRLVDRDGGQLVLAGSVLLEHFAIGDARSRWPDIPLLFHRGRRGRSTPKLYIKKMWEFGTVVSGRSRSAYMGKCDVEVKQGKIAYTGYYDTSRYKVFSDQKFQVSLNDFTVPVDVHALKLPGSQVFNFLTRSIDGHLWVQLAYEGNPADIDQSRRWERPDRDPRNRNRHQRRRVRNLFGMF